MLVKAELCQAGFISQGPETPQFKIKPSQPLTVAKRRQWHLTPVLLPGKSHGQRSLVGCGPWGREESDTTERLPFHFSLSCIGEGNDNPLQCSCLENPRVGGAWWAAVYGVTQSRTRLKRLSSRRGTQAPFEAQPELCWHQAPNQMPMMDFDLIALSVTGFQTKPKLNYLHKQ